MFPTHCSTPRIETVVLWVSSSFVEHRLTKIDARLFSAGIRAIFNLESPDEHVHCGHGNHESGFSYNPSEFMDVGSECNRACSSSLVLSLCLQLCHGGLWNSERRNHSRYHEGDELRHETRQSQFTRYDSIVRKRTIPMPCRWPSIVMLDWVGRDLSFVRTWSMNIAWRHMNPFIIFERNDLEVFKWPNRSKVHQERTPRFYSSFHLI